VTGRKHAEEELVRRTQELAESEAQYRTMGEAIPYGVWLCDADGGVARGKGEVDWTALARLIADNAGVPPG
jgi:PAS domain-containing protein